MEKEKIIKKIVKEAIELRRKELLKLNKVELINRILNIEDEFGLLPCNPLKYRKQLDKCEK